MGEAARRCMESRLARFFAYLLGSQCSLPPAFGGFCTPLSPSWRGSLRIVPRAALRVCPCSMGACAFSGYDQQASVLKRSQSTYPRADSMLHPKPTCTLAIFLATFWATTAAVAEDDFIR